MLGRGESAWNRSQIEPALLTKQDGVILIAVTVQLALTIEAQHRPAAKTFIHQYPRVDEANARKCGTPQTPEVEVIREAFGAITVGVPIGVP